MPSIDQIDKALDVVPHCCEQAQKHPIVYFYCQLTDEGFQEPKWAAKLLEFDCKNPLFRKYYGNWSSNDLSVPPKFCPYCGKALPKIVKRKRVKKPVSTCTDGGYNCATCGEDFHNCECYPPEIEYIAEDSDYGHVNKEPFQETAKAASKSMVMVLEGKVPEHKG